jgi:hypothetical protein
LGGVRLKGVSWDARKGERGRRNCVEWKQRMQEIKSAGRYIFFF